MSKPKAIAIDLIRIDAGTQFRAQINQDRVTDYAELLDGSKDWPFDSACEVFFDGLEYYLVDGFHRYHAGKRVKRSSLSCIVHSGTQRDAIKFALSANARHGLHRSNEDKRKAVAFVLADSEWSKLSSRAIAEICGVSDRFVESIRKTSTANGSQLDEKRTGKDGRTRSQPEPKADPKPEPKQTEPEPGGDEWDDVDEAMLTEIMGPAESETDPEPDAWQDVDDTPDPEPSKPEPTAKERASGLKSIVKQHNAAMMRAIDDLHGVLPNNLCHDMSHKSFRAIHEVIEAWR